MSSSCLPFSLAFSSPPSTGIANAVFFAVPRDAYLLDKVIAAELGSLSKLAEKKMLLRRICWQHRLCLEKRKPAFTDFIFHQ
ncbi:unnamed protein product, partial [Protopolystoma xenopodis]